MPTNTTGRALPVAALSDVPDENVAVNQLATALDAVASIYFGTLAARGPASTTVGTAKGRPGTLYWATDTSQLSLSYNGVWIDMGGASAPPIPVGASVEYGGSTDPTDARWLLEDGRAISRTTYAALFAAMGTTYGAGDGSTTFNIPDSRGRVTVGPDNMGTAAGAAGRLAGFSGGGVGRAGTGGTESVAITAAQTGIRNHTHGGTTGTENSSLSHTHGPQSPKVDILGQVGVSPIGWLATSGTNGVAGASATAGGGPSAHTHDFTTGNPNGGELSGAAHGNMPPYVVKNKIIRVL